VGRNYIHAAVYTKFFDDKGIASIQFVNFWLLLGGGLIQAYAKGCAGYQTNCKHVYFSEKNNVI
jgi:hypothetical protein